MGERQRLCFDVITPFVKDFVLKKQDEVYKRYDADPTPGGVVRQILFFCYRLEEEGVDVFDMFDDILYSLRFTGRVADVKKVLAVQKDLLDDGDCP